MGSLESSPSRAEVLGFIAKSRNYGNLGLFVGAGFSKAVLNVSEGSIALSWGELLRAAAKTMGVDYSEIPTDSISYPEIASILCQKFASLKNIPYKEASSELKRVLASLTCWHPTTERRIEFEKYLISIFPSWIITTNYDLILESLLTGRSIPLGPNDTLTNPKGIIPVYHLHGHRLNPEEIIISQEDYVQLFRPNEYRQIKLALTVKESTTLFVGYGLGDVNVLTAIDWSRNVYPDGKADYPHEVIQIVRAENPREAPYRDRNGIIILEVNDIVTFFEEFGAASDQENEIAEKTKAQLDALASELEESGEDTVTRFIEDHDFRNRIITTLAQSPVHLVSSFITLFEKSIEQTWVRAVPSGAFAAYKENLTIVLDILTQFKVEGLPPALFQTAAYAFDRVAWFVGRKQGESWAAADTWDQRKGQLSAEMITELRNISRIYSYRNLEEKLEGLT